MSYTTRREQHQDDRDEIERCFHESIDYEEVQVWTPHN